jgi:tetratricopeptide (TPR) repeat protein
MNPLLLQTVHTRIKLIISIAITTVVISAPVSFSNSNTTPIHQPPLSQEAVDTTTSTVNDDNVQRMTITKEGLALINDVDKAYEQLEDYPEDPEAYFLLAMAYSKTAYPERAFKALKKAKKYVRQHPKNFGYFDDLLDEYLIMLKNDPTNSNVLYRVSFAYFLKGYAVEEGYNPNDTTPPVQHYKTAAKYLEQLITLYPNDTWAKNYLGYLWIETDPNKTEQAINLWESVLVTEPNNPGAHALLAEAYMTQKNLRKALEHGAVALGERTRGEIKPLL